MAEHLTRNLNAPQAAGDSDHPTQRLSTELEARPRPHANVFQRGKFAFGFLPMTGPKITNNRKGTTFWQIASGHGVRTAVLEAPINFPPERLQNGVLLSGLGVPDIRGTMGTFSFWATNATGVGDTEMGGKIARIRVDASGRAGSVIHGPRNPLASRDR